MGPMYSNSARIATAIKRKQLKEKQNCTGEVECDFVALNPCDVDHEMQLKQIYDRCKKHRNGHSEFIEIRRFSRDHLKPHVPHSCLEILYNYLMASSKLTVRLLVSHTSSDRPSTYPVLKSAKNYPRYKYLEGKKYPYTSYRGRKDDYIRTGTGCVTKIYFSTDQGSALTGTCQCSPACKATKWGQIMVRTSRHVVFDTSEAIKTKVEFFFDGENSRRRTMYGSSCRGQDTAGDRAFPTIYTHDLDLLNYLNEKVNEKERLKQELFFRLKMSEYKRNGIDMKKQPFPTFIISHPHGQSQRISIGKNIEVLEVGECFSWDMRCYDVPTCSGCSGAPVFGLYWEETWWYKEHPHCWTLDTETNERWMSEASVEDPVHGAEERGNSSQDVSINESSNHVTPNQDLLGVQLVSLRATGQAQRSEIGNPAVPDIDLRDYLTQEELTNPINMEEVIPELRRYVGRSGMNMWYPILK